MVTPHVRIAAVACLFSAFAVIPIRAHAQQFTDKAPALPDLRFQDTQTPTDPSQGTGQKVAAAEEPAKPTRKFIPALFHNMGDDITHIPRRNSVYWLAAGTVTALAVHPADQYLNDHLSTSEGAKDFFVVGKYLGSFPVLIGTAAGTYLIGRQRSSQRGRHLGMDLIEATFLSEGLTELIKVIVRRERPIQDDGTRAAGFAFPSGHAAGTFAFATVLQQHLGWKWAVPTYLGASYVAMSRLVDDRHWASDVVAGATEGIIVGRSVTWHGRNFYASPMLVPKGAGIMINVQP
jgi:membrane-associated phospholipid phosphatase